ncbi:MAG TPA: hypothetical protein VF337_08740 [Candidatus Limnocylindrales bacterium]
MSGTIAAVALLVVVAVVVFAGAIRLGMLLGKRLDRALEARAEAGNAPGDGELGADQPGSTGASHREEDRGE